MRNTGILNVLCCIILFGPCYSFFGINLKVGPSPDEEGRYVYTVNGVKKHCHYCPDGALDNTHENERTQEYMCVVKYPGENILPELTPFEQENNKFPFCTIGEIPGCGPPPEERKTEGNTWSCDPGYSNVNYSVYFSCALISEKSRVVAWSYYCNEDLHWELDTSIPQVGTSMESTADDNAQVPTDPLGCGPPPEEEKKEGYIWSCDPGNSNVNYSVSSFCALTCEKSRAVAWSYYCNEDLKWELDTSIPGPQVGTSMESTSDDNALVPTDLPSCGPPPEEENKEGYIWSCDPGNSNVNYSVSSSCALTCEKSRAVAWSYFCNEDLKWKLDPNMTTDVSCRKTSGSSDDRFIMTVLIVVCFSLFCTSGVLVVMVRISWKRKRNVNVTHTESGNLKQASSGNEPSPLTEITSKERVSPLGEDSLTQVQTETSTVREHFHCNSNSYNCRNQKSSNDQLEIEITPDYTQSDHALTYPQTNHAPTYQQSDYVRSELQSSLLSNGCQYRTPQQLGQSRSPSPLDVASLLRKESLCDEGISFDSKKLSHGQELESGDDILEREHIIPTGSVASNTCLKTVYLGDKKDTRHVCGASYIMV